MTRYTDIESIIKAGIIKENDSPNCVKLMQRKLIEYNEGVSLTCVYPVLEIYSNPRKSMQGGFIGAAFDNAYGALVYLTTKKMDMATIDLNVSYHKPIYENDRLTVTVYLKALGKTIIHLTGEAFDGQGNLIASSTTNFFMLEKSTILTNNTKES